MYKNYKLQTLHMGNVSDMDNILSYCFFAEMKSLRKK